MVMRLLTGHIVSRIGEGGGDQQEASFENSDGGSQRRLARSDRGVSLCCF